MQETGEVFLDYESYLDRYAGLPLTPRRRPQTLTKDRRDYYKQVSQIYTANTAISRWGLSFTRVQRKFTCEITGHSGLTFFQARDSEVRFSGPFVRLDQC